MRFSFHELRYQKATAHIADTNQTSLRLFERLVYTGVRHYDYIAYGMTVDEFNASEIIALFDPA